MISFREFLESYADRYSSDSSSGSPGQFKGGLDQTADFGTGWKIRLIPKRDADNYLIKKWLDDNRSILRQYKIAHNSGDSHVWTVYTASGSAEEARFIAEKAKKALGPFIQTDKLYQDEDAIIPGTGVSGRFEMRAEKTPRHKEIANKIASERRRTAIYELFKRSPMFDEGFPRITAGKGGVPGTSYYAWLVGTANVMRGRGADPVVVKMYEDEAQAELNLIHKVLGGFLGSVYSMG
jgi:hypothetical protein